MERTHLQKQILLKGLTSPRFAKDILPKAPESIYERNVVLKNVNDLIIHYYRHHSDVPSESAMNTLAEDFLERKRHRFSESKHPEFFQVISELYELTGYEDEDDHVIEEQMDTYIRNHMTMDVMKKTAKNMTDSNSEEVSESLAEEIQSISLLDITGNSTNSIDLTREFDKVERVLSDPEESVVPMGIPEIDNTNGGGMARGEVAMVISSSGAGKTLSMTNFSSAYARQGFNVLHITLEEKVKRMAMRVYQPLFSQTIDAVMGQDGKVNNSFLQGLNTIYNHNPEATGRFILETRTPGTVTPNQIEQLIFQTQKRYGIKLDVVTIDYPDLLLNPRETGNESRDGEVLFQHIKKIALNQNVVIWTASQSNRMAGSERIKTANTIEGSKRKLNILDFCMTINQSKPEFDEGYIRYYLDKVRNNVGTVRGSLINLRVDVSRMTLRSQSREEERRHEQLLEQVDELENSQFRGNKKKKEDSGEKIDFANEINQAVKGGKL